MRTRRSTLEKEKGRKPRGSGLHSESAGGRTKENQQVGGDWGGVERERTMTRGDKPRSIALDCV